MQALYHSVFMPKLNISRARLEARITTKQKHLFQHAADLVGRSLTDFIITAVQEAAEKVIQQREIIQLSPKDRKLLINSFLKPSKPNKLLKKAYARYLKEVKA